MAVLLSCWLVVVHLLLVPVGPYFSLVNTLPITKKNKHTVVTEAQKKVHVLLSR